MAERTISTFDRTRLAEAAAAWETANFARTAGIGERRMARLLRGETEFRQDEMLRIAAMLHLGAREIEDYFFTPEVQKI